MFDQKGRYKWDAWKKHEGLATASNVKHPLTPLMSVKADIPSPSPARPHPLPPSPWFFPTHRDDSIQPDMHARHTLLTHAPPHTHSPAHTHAQAHAPTRAQTHAQRTNTRTNNHTHKHTHNSHTRTCTHPPTRIVAAILMAVSGRDGIRPCEGEVRGARQQVEGPIIAFAIIGLARILLLTVAPSLETAEGTWTLPASHRLRLQRAWAGHIGSAFPAKLIPERV